jgi:hypothetical protein
MSSPRAGDAVRSGGSPHTANERSPRTGDTARFGGLGGDQGVTPNSVAPADPPVTEQIASSSSENTQRPTTRTRHDITKPKNYTNGTTMVNLDFSLILMSHVI